MALTDTAIRNATAGLKDRKLADEKGLYLLVTAGGSDGTRWITLSGVHFHRLSLASLGPAASQPDTPETNRGRKPKYDWPTAINTCWGRIYRGEPPVANQADVEKLLIDILRVGDDEPGESTVRPYARQIWAEHTKP